ncbi:hypothetical protein [Streptomyces sp. CFMR 7]|uniref:hypothetical protein n=1 Tax=Streptomyces sp. CFMR 7 TaxID=1649184 RepID=UPI001642D75B|nr:hypothetical protein [Streptomyces sp. CFMR 7]
MVANDGVARLLMRDLRVLAGCDALLTALEGGPIVAQLLALVEVRAASASDHARAILMDYQVRTGQTGEPGQGD